MNKLKKQEIINIAIDLFAEYGISNVSIAMIAKTLGASKGKVYHYFKNGKDDIVAEILKAFEQYVCCHILDKNELEFNDTTANEILCSMFFEFSHNDTYRVRKIIRIFMSEMYYDNQIAQYVINHLIVGREKMLADYFTSLVDAGKFFTLDAESTARYLNRLMLVYAIEDTVQFPFVHDESKMEQHAERMVRDCINLIHCMADN